MVEWQCKANVDEKKSKYQIWYKVKNSPNEEKARIEYAKAKRLAKKAVALAQQNEKQKLVEQLHYKRRKMECIQNCQANDEQKEVDYKSELP